MSFNNNHKIIIFTAPSGSGKTTIAHRVMSQMPQLSFSVSAVSRPRREHEVDGKDYHFISTEDFKKKIENGEFLEYEEVYKDILYGTLKDAVLDIVDEDKTPVFDIDFKGAKSLKKIYGDNALIIYIKVPIEIVKERLIARGTETEESLQKRINRFKEEMSFESEADVVVENIILEDAVSECVSIINDFLKL